MINCGCCPSIINPSPILFFATSTETATANLIGAGEVTVLTLGVSPASAGTRQVKLDSTVQLLATGALLTINYNVSYRLRRSDLVSPLATLTISRATTITLASTFTDIPNLTWNDSISTSVTYTVTIQVNTSTGLSSVVAQTRALNAIVF
ncbi:hypothetical protein SAMN05444487_11320 [Marininema mesophilum]|uniref:SipW-cognate class signal peptide n=1 Tax=Marininema mesophilum TaxID=1048340 RepID=A0A1H3AB06_9BACL|nr:hypothetical protein [Marininema mesophilum]SDX26836.1 hypothetical protein SAMN05444487_11320 [Marininema mesophilum]